MMREHQDDDYDDRPVKLNNNENDTTRTLNFSMDYFEHGTQNTNTQIIQWELGTILKLSKWVNRKLF